MSKKKTDDEVGDILLSYGYIKIGQYKSARETIKCKDADGYIIYPVLYRLYDGKTPLRFHCSNPNTIDNIKHYININNINVELCSNEFIDAKSKMIFKCLCGNLYQTTLDDFIHGKYCCNDCTSYGGKYVPFEKVLASLQNKGLMPLFSENEYNGICDTKLPIVNKLGYKAVFSQDYYYKDDIEPSWFYVSNPYTIENINVYLSNVTNGEYVCISDKYNGNKDPLIILHKECGNTFEAKWINLYRKSSEKEPNRHGTQCPYCTGLRHQSLHAIVLKQMFQKLYLGTVVEDQSCRNPLTNCILPTDIVNHNEKIAIEIQSWWHDKEYQRIKDKIKKEYWESRGYIVYTPDIRNYSVIDMVKLFFPDVDKVPEWVDYKFDTKLNTDMAQSLLNNGLLVPEIAEKMNVPSHRIYDAIYDKRLYYPNNYPNKHLTKQNDFLN